MNRFTNFEEFKKAWHAALPETVKSGSMYQNGQFSDIPYVIWSAVENSPNKEEILEYSLGKV